MEIKEAIEILRKHNKWRCGADIPMVSAKVLTEAINKIIEKYEEEE